MHFCILAKNLPNPNVILGLLIISSNHLFFSLNTKTQHNLGPWCILKYVKYFFQMPTGFNSAALHLLGECLGCCFIIFIYFSNTAPAAVLSERPKLSPSSLWNIKNPTRTCIDFISFLTGVLLFALRFYFHRALSETGSVLTPNHLNGSVNLLGRKRETETV